MELTMNSFRKLFAGWCRAVRHAQRRYFWTENIHPAWSKILSETTNRSLATSRVFDTGRTDITHGSVWRSGNLDVPQLPSAISTERLPVRLVSPRGTRQPPAIPERDYTHAVWSSVFVELADARIGQLRQRDFVVLSGITCDF